MQRRLLAFLVVSLSLFSTLAAQLADPGPSRGRSAPFSLNFHTSFGHGHHGFFGLGWHGFGRGFFVHPFHFAPLHFSFPQPFFFSGRNFRHQRRFAGPGGFRFHAGPAGAPFFFDSGYNFNYNRFVAGPDRGGWDWFVEEWGDEDPRLPEGGQTDLLAESLLLREGMSPEEVLLMLGSPIQRVELAGRQIWKYSGYSLLFEDGALKEMR